MERIDHTKCQHEATPKARKACRKARFALDMEASKMGRKPSDWSDEAKAATTWVDLAQPAPEPYRKRAIVVNMKMASGKRCSATFDRYGQNAGLFTNAYTNGWSAERTVAQAVSEALAGALRTYPGDSTVDYRVVEVD